MWNHSKCGRIPPASQLVTKEPIWYPYHTQPDKQAAAALLFRVRRVPIVLENTPESAGWERVSRAEMEEGENTDEESTSDLSRFRPYPMFPPLKTRDKKNQWLLRPRTVVPPPEKKLSKKLTSDCWWGIALDTMVISKVSENGQKSRGNDLRSDQKSLSPSPDGLGCLGFCWRRTQTTR